MKLKTLITLIKYLVAIGLLVLVLSQVGVETLLDAAKQTNPIWLIAAFISFTLAQFFSVLRMNAYYRWHDKPIAWLYSLKLHYVSLFYNLIIPGGIGGDGYKIYQLKKQFDYGAKEGVKIQLITRFNGLWVIALSILLLALPMVSEQRYILMLLMLAGSAVYLLVFPKVMALPVKNEVKALPYSIAIQLCNLICIAMLCEALATEGQAFGYLLLFQVAAIVSMIPITIGGLGLRELTFYLGAEWIGAHSGHAVFPEVAVTISLLFFAITLVSALIGGVFASQAQKAYNLSE